MSEQSSVFIEKSTVKSADRAHRHTINHNIGKYNAVVPQGKSQFAELSQARERAKNAKWKALEQLDHFLELFETNITRRGAKVIWAETDQQANEEK